MKRNFLGRVGLVLSLLYLPVTHAQNKVTVNADQTVSINGNKVFPISVYIQSDWQGVKDLGVNTVSRPFCVNSGAVSQAENNQLYLHYTAGPGCDSQNASAIKSRNSSVFQQSVNQVKNSNYLFGYGLPDEPKSATGLSASDTKWAYDVIKATDPNHPVFITEYSSDISAYKDSADIFLNDQYPFNNNLNPLYDIKTKVLDMQRQVAPKPVWLIIQTGSQFGMPTNAQIRAETYLSIALGSTGMIFYSYDVEDAGGVNHIKKDGDIFFMKNLIAELKSFSPYFLGSKNNSLSYASNHVDAILKNYNGKSYLIAVNKSDSPQNISFSLSGMANAPVKILGLANAGSSRAGQTKTVSSSGVLSDALQGLEAVVYEIGSSAQAGVKLFQHCNYDGYSATLSAGSYNTQALVSLGLKNNDISSIRVPAGYKATLFDGDNFTGNSLVWTEDDSCFVSSNFNDVLSSLRIEKPAGENRLISPVQNGSYDASSGVPVKFSLSSDVAHVLLYSSDAWTNFASITAPFTYTWFPSEAGEQVLKYEFYDSSWNFIEGSSGSVNLKYNASVDSYFVSPVTNNPEMSGEIHVQTHASDPNVGGQTGDGVQNVFFELMKGEVAVASRQENLAPYDWYFDTSAFANGLYTIKATVKSAAASGDEANIISTPITISN
ncbi:Development-specific protein S [Thalassocella blandensis]|nr:Development-specific protein S [Thalassocella blandensis]